MAIDGEKLSIRFGSQLSLGRPYRLALAWEVVHSEWVPETVVASGYEQAVVKDLGRIADVDAGLQALMAGRLAEVKDQNKARTAMEYQSLADVAQIWDRWTFVDHGDGTMTATHPVCGEFTGECEDTPLGRVNGILSVCLPPPAWAWFDSVAEGALRTKCVAVPGASKYSVYSDTGDALEYLGDVADAGVRTLYVPAGSYVIRMAAVNGGGRVGILSRAQSVTVLGGAESAMVGIESLGAISLDGANGPGRWERFRAWFARAGLGREPESENPL